MQIPISNEWFDVAKILNIATCVLLLQCFSLPMTMNTVLTYILYQQFYSTNDLFKNDIGRLGKFNGVLALYRRRHQALSLSRLRTPVCEYGGRNTNLLFMKKHKHQVNQSSSHYFLHWARTMEHQALSRLVQTADSFIMIGNAGLFVGQVFLIVVLVYAFAFTRYPDQSVAVIYWIQLVLHGFGLSVCILNGVFVNSVVRFNVL